jgi:hypothetical protein
MAAARRAARRVLGGDLRREAQLPVARVADQLAVRATPDGSACGFYGAAFTELLRLLAGYEGALLHTNCRARGAGRCEWRAATSTGASTADAHSTVRPAAVRGTLAELGADGWLPSISTVSTRWRAA